MFTGETTPTGVKIIACDTCGRRHPETRKHCTGCNSPSAFQKDGLCLRCAGILK